MALSTVSCQNTSSHGGIISYSVTRDRFDFHPTPQKRSGKAGVSAENSLSKLPVPKRNKIDYYSEKENTKDTTSY